MTNSPLITTVMPTYRRPFLLRRAIQSVLRQTHPALRVCVYDNASGDETASVVAELARADPRVAYHCHERNIGGYANFQYGLDHITTPFFSILADDDVLLPDFYRVAMAGFEQHPEALSSMCGAIHVDDVGKVWLVQGVDWRPGLYPPPEGMLALLRGHFPPPWTCFVFRREALEVTGPLDESVGNAADYDFQFRLTATRPLVVSSQPGAITVSHRAAESVKSRQTLTWAKWKGSARLRSKLLADSELPEAVRIRGLPLLVGRLHDALFRTYWLKAVLSGQWSLANRALVVYRELGYVSKAKRLACVQTILHAIPLTRRLARLAYRLFIYFRGLKDRGARQRFTDDVSRFLKVER